MAVVDTVLSASSLGNGVTVEFPLPFRFLQNSDIYVQLDGVDQTTGFTVTGAGNPAGGTVTFAVAPASGVLVFRERRVQLTQDVDIQNNETIFENAIDQGFDKLTMMVQQQQDAIDRSVKVAPGFDPISPQDVLDAAQAVAGKANTDFSNLAAPAQAILDAKATRTLSNLQPVNQLLGGTLIDFSPIGNGGGTKGHLNLLFDDTNESVSVRQFDFALGANYSKGTPGTGGGSPSGPGDEGAKVLMYGGVNMRPGCYKAWAQNLLLHIEPGTPVEYVNVVEFDIDNYAGVNYGSGIGTAGLTGAAVWGVTINGANPGANTVTGAQAIISSATGPIFERGYVVAPGAVVQAAFDDYSSATASYRDLGTHSYGIDLSGTYSALGVRVPNGVSYGAKRNNNANATLMTLNSSNNMQLATSGVTDTFVGTSFYPNQDNTKALGGTTFRWVKAFLGQLSLTTLGVYADNAAAVTAGLSVGDVYRTATGQLMVRF